VREDDELDPARFREERREEPKGTLKIDQL